MTALSPSRFFPPVQKADRSGLVAVGGKLTSDWLLDAYCHGIFPWPVNDEVLAWWSPDPRAVLSLDVLHVSRSLKRTLGSGKFEITRDRDFAGVIRGCRTAQDRAEGTWITDDIERAYNRLHREGLAHSIEVWSAGGGLAGGVYGVALAAAFSAESMFYRVRDASKVALVHLVAHLKARGYQLLDIQQLTPHMVGLGAIEIPRRVFLKRLASALESPVTFTDFETSYG